MSPVPTHQPTYQPQGLDLIVNALDNVNARLYVDSRCVEYNSI